MTMVWRHCGLSSHRSQHQPRLRERWWSPLCPGQGWRRDHSAEPGGSQCQWEDRPVSLSNQEEAEAHGLERKLRMDIITAFCQNYIFWIWVMSHHFYFYLPPLFLPRADSCLGCLVVDEHSSRKCSISSWQFCVSEKPRYLSSQCHVVERVRSPS